MRFASLPRFALAGLGLSLLCLTPAPAVQLAGEQPALTDEMALARRAATTGDSAEALARFLRVLAADPRDLEALTGAGRAALDIGDANAAISFYARAEEIAPRDGRIKAGLGSAMTALVQPRAALKLFDEAIELGVSAADIAADRGLAYDLRGDNKRARADYELALRTRPDDETSRRLALSLAMAGDPVGALATLDPLLRKQDRAAWRTRAFVMAISGDAKGAEASARAVLLRPQADALVPFFQRLPKLRASQQAAAVHFGQFPSDGKSYSEREMLAAAGVDAPLPAPITSLTSRQGTESGSGDGDGYEDSGATKSRKIERAKPEKALPLARKPKLLATAAPSAEAAPPSPAAVSEPAHDKLVAKKPALLASDFTLAPAQKPKLAAAETSSDTKPSKTKALAEAAPGKAKPDTGSAKTSAQEPSKADKLAKAKADAKDKSKDTAKDTAKAKLKDKPDSSAKSAEAKKADAKNKAAASKEPSRYWVQVATGAYKPDLDKEWGKLKAKYPALLGRFQPWTTPLNRTNRLMIGPFKTSAEAQGFVNKSGATGFTTSPVTTPAGQVVERVN